MAFLDRNQSINRRELNALAERSRSGGNITVAGINVETSGGNPLLTAAPTLTRPCTARIIGPAVDGSDKIIYDDNGRQLYQWIETQQVFVSGVTYEMQDLPAGQSPRGSVDNGDGTYQNLAHEANGNPAYENDQVIVWAGCVNTSPATAGQISYEHVFYKDAAFPFEFYSDCTPGATGVLVWPLKADLTQDTSISPPTLTVSDSLLGNVRAYGSNHSGFTTGAKGWYRTIGGVNVIVECERLSKLLTGTTTTCVNSGSSITVNTVVVCDDEQSPTAGNTSTTLTVANPFNWQCSASGAVIDFRADGSGGWRFTQGKCDMGCP